MICTKGKAKRLSFDHKGTDKSERDRIQSIGGFVTEKGRVMGDLAVARSLGDVSCSPYITSKPHVSEISVTDDVDFMIIGCDGLFDVIEDQMACDLVNRFPPDKSSMVLRDFSYLFSSGDNISVIVIHFSKSLERKGSLLSMSQGANVKKSTNNNNNNWVPPSKARLNQTTNQKKIFSPNRRSVYSPDDISNLQKEIEGFSLNSPSKEPKNKNNNIVILENKNNNNNS